MVNCIEGTKIRCVKLFWITLYINIHGQERHHRENANFTSGVQDRRVFVHLPTVFRCIKIRLLPLGSWKLRNEPKISVYLLRPRLAAFNPENHI